MIRAAGCLLLMLVAPVALSAEEEPEAPQSAKLIIPAVGHVRGVGGVEWRADVVITNTVGKAVSVVLTLPMLGPAAFVMQDLEPGQRLVYHDVVFQLFGASETISPLEVFTIGSDRSVSVSAMTYGVKGGKVTPTSPIEIVQGDPYLGVQTLSGLAWNEQLRTNIGLVNLGESATTFTLAVQRIAGRNLATTQVTVPPQMIYQLAINRWFPLLPEGVNLRVIVEANAPNTFCYGWVIDNETNEPQYALRSIGN